MDYWSEHIDKGIQLVFKYLFTALRLGNSLVVEVEDNRHQQ